MVKSNPAISTSIAGTRAETLWLRWLATSDARRAWSLVLLCGALFVLVNWRHIPSDNIATPLLPVTLFRHGTLSLDAYRDFYAELPDEQNYSFIETDEHLYPRKSYFSALLAAPLFLPPILLGVPDVAVDPEAAPGERYSVAFWINWGRLVTALLTGVSVALVYVGLRRWGSVAEATAFSLLFAFGTCTWSIIGQTLSHQLGGVVCTAALLVYLRDFPLSSGRAAWVGFLAGATVVMRPPTLFLLFPLGLYLLLPGLLAGNRARLSALAGVALLPLANAVANSVMFGHWYSTGYSGEERTGWTSPILEGAAGLLLSPNSGLWTQSPFTLLAVIGGWVVWRGKEVPDAGLLRAYGLCFVGYWLMFSCWHDWKGGLTFATRMLCEGYPLWMPLVLVGWQQIRHLVWARNLAVAAGIYSVAYQLVNIAVFDRVCTQPFLYESAFVRSAGRWYPWQPAEHFFALHIRHFGVLTTLTYVGRTSICFLLLVPAVIFALKPLWVGPGPATTESLTE